MAKSRTFKYGSNVEVCINTEDQIFEYYDEATDDYLCGGFWTDLDGKKIMDYDGCFQLPVFVMNAFIECGYDLSELEVWNEIKKTD